MFGASTAHASGQIEIPNGCGTVDEYQAGIHARLGAEASELLEALSVKIAPRGAEYELDVRLGTSRRQIVDQDCRALLRAAIVVAVALWESPKRPPKVGADPVSGQQESSEPPHEPSAPEGSDDTRPTLPNYSPAVLPPPLPAYVPEASAAGERNRSASRWSAAIEGRAGAVAGLVPSVGVMFELAPSLRYRSLEFGAAVNYVVPREQIDAAGYGVGVSAFGVAPGLTWYLHPRVGLHGGVAGYYLRGTGRGSERNQTDHAWTFGPQVGISARVLEYRQAWIALGGVALLELNRPRFEIRAYGEVFRPFWATGSVHLGVGFAFD